MMIHLYTGMKAVTQYFAIGIKRSYNRRMATKRVTFIKLHQSILAETLTVHLTLPVFPTTTGFAHTVIMLPPCQSLIKKAPTATLTLF